MELQARIEDKKVYISKNGTPLIYTTFTEVSRKGTYEMGVVVNKIWRDNNNTLIIPHYSEDPSIGRSEYLENEISSLRKRRGERIDATVYYSRGRFYFYETPSE